jgi:predicted nucleic-acid-binding protein
MRRIYLDSNVLVALYSTDKAEEVRRGMVENVLTVLAQFKELQLCTSIWAITEMVKVLVSNKKMDRENVAQIESQLVSAHLRRFWPARETVLPYSNAVGVYTSSVCT